MPYIIISFPSFVDIQGLSKVLKLKKVWKEKPKKVILRKIFFEKLFTKNYSSELTIFEKYFSQKLFSPECSH